jgi:hypothetical protein
MQDPGDSVFLTGLQPNRNSTIREIIAATSIRANVATITDTAALLRRVFNVKISLYSNTVEITCDFLGLANCYYKSVLLMWSPYFGNF